MTNIVLIRCSKCSKEYHLNPDKLPQPKFLEGQGEGWWMSCAHCNHQWWHQAKNMPSQEQVFSVPIRDFQNFTNLDGLHRGLRQSESQGKTAPEFYKPFNPEQQKNPQESDTITTVTARVLKTDPRKIKGVLSSPRIAVVLFTIFLASIFGVFSFGYKDQLLPMVKNILFSPQPSLATAAAPLVLQNVKYGVQPTADGKISLTVVGEILNDNSSTVTLLPVRVVVWSYCPENGNIQTPGSPDANCIKADWHHPWTRPHILPGERLWFQTGTVLPANTQIVRVDVTLP